MHNLSKVSFGIIALVGVNSFVPAMASPYPSDYGYQHVRIITEGPALFAHEYSGVDSAEVIGYKKSGILAQDNPEKIDAVISTSCWANDELSSKTTTVVLGREWNGTGYMSAPHSFYNYLSSGCKNSSEGDRHILVGIAFSANGKWDSKNSQNYGYHGRGFYNNSDARVYDTTEYGYGNINFAIWNFIVGEMRN